MSQGGQVLGNGFANGAVWGLGFDVFFVAIFGILKVAVWAYHIPAIGKLVFILLGGAAAWAVGMFWVWLREELSKRNPVPWVFQLGIMITFSPLLVGLALLILQALRG